MRSPRLIDALALELEKIAGVGTSALTTGVLGAGAGGVLGYMGSKEEGIGGKLRDAAKGAALTGAATTAVGAGAAGLSKLTRRGAPAVMSGPNATSWARSLDERIGNFGKRQVHALTGYVPKGQESAGYTKSIGIGGYDHGQGAVDAAQHRLANISGKDVNEDMLPNILPRSVRKLDARWDLHTAKKSMEATKGFAETGATSIPGMVRAVADPTKRGKVMRSLGTDLVYGGGTLGTGMMAMGAHDLYKGVAGHVQPGQEDMGHGERLGDSVGSAAGYLLPSPIPMAGQMLGGEVLKKSFGAVGAGVDKLRSKPSVVPPRVPPHDPTDPVASTANQLGGHQSSMSSSAAGSSYGSGIQQ